MEVSCALEIMPKTDPVTPKFIVPYMAAGHYGASGEFVQQIVDMACKRENGFARILFPNTEAADVKVHR